MKGLTLAFALGTAVTATSIGWGVNPASATVIPLRPAKESLTFTATTPRMINSLGIEFSNSAPFNLIDKNKGLFDVCTPLGSNVQPPRAGGSLLCKSAAGIAANTKVTIGFTTVSHVNDLKIEAARWDFVDNNTVTLIDFPANQIDFKVVPVGDPQSLFTITNTSNNYLLFKNLSFLNNSPELPLEAEVGSLPGFTLFEDSLLIAPNSVSPDFIFPELDPLNFLYIESEVFLSDSAGTPLANTGYQTRFGHQAPPVPEPSSTFGLLALGTLGAASTLNRKLKSSNPSEKEATKVS